MYAFQYYANVGVKSKWVIIVARTYFISSLGSLCLFWWEQYEFLRKMFGFSCLLLRYLHPIWWGGIWIQARTIKGNLIHFKHLLLRNLKPAYHTFFKGANEIQTVERLDAVWPSLEPRRLEDGLWGEISWITGLNLDTLGMLSLTFRLHSPLS